ncbi:MAG: type II toxin-antitoxin system RelE/ParE family toxin [Actinobacteria bacterium]|nr:type II toxin-antitoxin system RelE/ParE family toxin [Actinomycetota bacterium]MBI3686729.1 type II toxin-antitoxin system RelE/ParE family toxin [Actinomycetota bacterium]
MAIDKPADDVPTLGRPLADTVKGSRHHNMKELRPGSSGSSEIRVLFAFVPVRQAILLIAGDKAGNWQQWYRQAIPAADDRFDEHLQNVAIRQSTHDERGGDR